MGHSHRIAKELPVMPISGGVNDHLARQPGSRKPGLTRRRTVELSIDLTISPHNVGKHRVMIRWHGQGLPIERQADLAPAFSAAVVYIVA